MCVSQKIWSCANKFVDSKISIPLQITRNPYRVVTLGNGDAVHDTSHFRRKKNLVAQIRRGSVLPRLAAGAFRFVDQLDSNRGRHLHTNN
mmetsp:Transcript_15577/g.32240  ORF Transcript_15577/g.32240 Transcript_15577/m.32240 type:complete len:90 (+) Transcript_15577:102-371(+)